jgi:hypothetical protein
MNLSNKIKKVNQGTSTKQKESKTRNNSEIKGINYNNKTNQNNIRKL